MGCWGEGKLNWISMFKKKKKTWQRLCLWLSANHSDIDIVCLLSLGLYSIWLCKADSEAPTEEDVRSKREGMRR